MENLFIKLKPELFHGGLAVVAMTEQNDDANRLRYSNKGEH
jgi:hypothetical protein